jgi:hypothetical protein
MFGIFSRRRQQERWATQGVRVAALHRKMREDTPAAAYLFARTLCNARPFISDHTVPLSQKIEHTKLQMRRDNSLDKIDDGIATIALQFIVVLLESQQHVELGSFALSGAFGEISTFGSRYRELNEQDRLPPDNEKARQVLMKNNHSCLADLISAMRADYVALRANASKAERVDVEAENEAVWSMLAMFDLLKERSSGRLAPYRKALEHAISGV